eukprot:TRINITY_DN79059_c0_g1_i1.p1 TRINITY_DN79059_c0_g1~~TRINITY_DN79059_c0_g1_i1.p1  ORF type:complete len:359 (-),score=56.23 TRINITY_DN79059_c0_g1_i1:37-1113(-)
MMMSKMLDQRDCDVKGLARSSVAISEEEETKTQTPRSSPESYDGSASDASGNGPECGDLQDDDDDDYDNNGSYTGDDEYYSFLREMAGSFEATYDDEEESEGGSEDEAAGEAVPTASRKRSSSFRLCDTHGRAAQSPAKASVPPVPATQGGYKMEETTKLGDSSAQVKPQSAIHGAGYGTRPPAAGMDRATRPVPLRPGVAAVTAVAAVMAVATVAGIGGGGTASPGGSTSAGSCQRTSSDGNLSELSDNEDREDFRFPAVPSPTHDNRGPVEDDYDVVKAIEHFASQRSGDPREFQKEDLRTSIDQKTAQANQLLVSVHNSYTTPELRAHYARVHGELLAEVVSLREKLDGVEQELH